MWKWKETQTDTREAQEVVQLLRRRDLDLTLWNKISIYKSTAPLLSPDILREQERTHLQARTGTGSTGSRQPYLTRSEGGSGQRCHFL